MVSNELGFPLFALDINKHSSPNVAKDLKEISILTSGIPRINGLAIIQLLVILTANPHLINRILKSNSLFFSMQRSHAILVQKESYLCNQRTCYVIKMVVVR